MRSVICGDAFEYLAQENAFKNASCVTSLPDISELPGSDLTTWSTWFSEAAAKIMDRVPDDAVAIFFQTDVFRFGRWVDKSALLFRAADHARTHLLWHKIVCRVAPGTVSDGRPGFAHMLCFSRALTHARATSSPDVLTEAGSMDWSNAMGRTACMAACRWVRDNTTTRAIVDPFCGTGTVLAVANELGLDAVGIEIDPERADRARKRR